MRNDRQDTPPELVAIFEHRRERAERLAKLKADFNAAKAPLQRLRELDLALRQAPGYGEGEEVKGLRKLGAEERIELEREYRKLKPLRAELVLKAGNLYHVHVDEIRGQLIVRHLILIHFEVNRRRIFVAGGGIVHGHDPALGFGGFAENCFPQIGSEGGYAAHPGRVISHQYNPVQLRWETHAYRDSAHFLHSFADLQWM